MVPQIRRAGPLDCRGRAYDQSRGLEDWRTWPVAPVAPRVMKRYAL